MIPIKTVTFSINIDPLKIDSLSTTADDGFSNGAFHLAIKGGLPPYAVSWKSANNTSGNNQEHLAAGKLQRNNRRWQWLQPGYTY
jgi:hypothetical protein